MELFRPQRKILRFYYAVVIVLFRYIGYLRAQPWCL